MASGWYSLSSYMWKAYAFKFSRRKQFAPLQRILCDAFEGVLLAKLTCSEKFYSYLNIQQLAQTK